MSLATWQDTLIRGSEDGSICVCDVRTGDHEATLRGHRDCAQGVLVVSDRLLNTSDDGTTRIREWAAGTWEALRTIQANARRGEPYPHRLVASGWRLISGSYIPLTSGWPEMQVWDLESLRPEHTVLLPYNQSISALVAGQGQV